MKPIWIELVNSGVANRFEFEDHELIELNWRLTNHPSLYYSIIQHELNHQEGSFKSKDLLHDMTSRTPGLFKFMFNHLSAWTQVLPVYWDRRRKKVVYDISSIISWIMLGATTTGVFLLLRWLL